MLKKRLIPKLQLKLAKVGGDMILTLVNTVNFEKYLTIGDPISQAKIFQSQAADELIFLDLDSHLNTKDILINLINNVSEEIFMPITVGGGIDSLTYVKELLHSGADKVSLNSAAVKNPELISNISNFFGQQCVVVSIDFSKKTSSKSNRVFINGGKEETALDPVEWAIKSEKLGAGEILLTSIDNDGTYSGLNLNLIKKVSDSVSIPVIASGGCGKASHFIDGFLKAKADAVAAGSYFSNKDQNPMQTRAHISNAGIPVRLHT